MGVSVPTSQGGWMPMFAHIFVPLFLLDLVFAAALPKPHQICQEEQNKNKSMHSTNNFYEIQTPMNDERQEVLRS